MKKFLIFIFLIFLIIWGIFYFGNYFIKPISFYQDKFFNELNLVLKDFNLYQTQLLKEKNLIEPLVSSESNSSQGFLTSDGILEWTNFYRVKNKLNSLNENEILDKIASLRINDMFEKQYFAHYSKEGIGAPQFAEELNYEYIAIGENIALGNFKDDKELVDAWMNSPAHRENILNNKYTEIGIAVKHSKFKDEKMSKEEDIWIAVQIFGKPLSFCQKPDENLKLQIENLQNEISSLKTIANELYAYLDKNNILSSQKEIEIYNKKVWEYNNLVNEINKKIIELKILVSKYNLEVESFNQCIKL